MIEGRSKSCFPEAEKSTACKDGFGTCILFIKWLSGDMASNLRTGSGSGYKGK